MQQLVLSIDNYKSEDNFWNAVRLVLNLLTDNKYIVVFRYEDAGNYIFEYAPEDKSLGDDYPIWVNPEVYEEWYFENFEKYKGE